MQLTHYTDYGLRVLMFLALQADDRLITITEISEHFTIPRNHLVKIVQRLGQLGYIQTVRGKGGGMRLGRPAEEIGVGSVVRDLESTLDIVDCSKPPCPLNGGCALKGILDEAQQAFLHSLDAYTLADLTPRPRALRQRLQWPARQSR